MKKKERKRKNGLFYVFRHFRINWVLTILAVVLSVAASTQTSRIPDETGKLFDGSFRMEQLWTVIGVSVLAAVLTFCGDVATSTAESRAVRSLQQSAWKKMMEVGVDYYDSHDPSKQVSLITTDAEGIGSGVILVIILLPTVLTTIGMSTLQLFQYSAKLLLVLLLIIPMNIVYLIVVGRWQERVMRESSFAAGQLMGYLSERIRNLSMIKVFTAEKREKKNGEQAAEKLYTVGKEIAVLGNVIVGFSTVSTVISTIVTVLWGCVLLRSGDITQAQFVAFSLYVPAINLAFSLLSIVWTFIKGYSGTAFRLCELFSHEAEQMDSQKQAEAAPEGDMAFSDVRFRYPNAAKTTLDGLNFTIPAHRVTALIGPSGSGKSTIIKLIEKLYRPEDGRITVGDTDLGTVGVAGWRRNIAYVAQDSGLFSGTLKSAILYGADHEPTEEELRSVIDRVGLSDFIGSLPKGLDTELEAWGSSLSGGQRQRIAIARALLKNAELFILDEPTSALDPETANAVSDLIFKGFPDKTVVVITHELGYITAADHIVVIRDGKVQGEGGHEELMNSCRVYRDLVQEQSYREVFA